MPSGDLTTYVAPPLNELSMRTTFGTPSTVYKVEANKNYSLKVTIGSIIFKNFVSLGPNLYNADLNVEVVSKKRTLSPLVVKNIYLEFDPSTNKVSGCSIFAEDAITQCTFEGSWFYYDEGGSNDFGITCRDGRITGWCGNADPDGGDSPRGFRNGYFCEGNSLIKVPN